MSDAFEFAAHTYIILGDFIYLSKFFFILYRNALFSLKRGKPQKNSPVVPSIRLQIPDQPKSPERSGTRVVPMSATPPPAMSCFIPWLLAPDRDR